MEVPTVHEGSSKRRDSEKDLVRVRLHTCFLLRHSIDVKSRGKDLADKQWIYEHLR